MIKDDTTPNDILTSLRMLYIEAKRNLPMNAKIEEIWKYMDNNYSEFIRRPGHEILFVYSQIEVVNTRYLLHSYYPIYSNDTLMNEIIITNNDHK